MLCAFYSRSQNVSVPLSIHSIAGVLGVWIKRSHQIFDSDPEQCPMTRLYFRNFNELMIHLSIDFKLICDQVKKSIIYFIKTCTHLPQIPDPAVVIA